MNSSDTPSEELLNEYLKTKDMEVRNQIVSSNLFLAQTLSRKFTGRGIEYDDLLQVASLALIKAVERYDPKFDTKFITFATPTIIGELKKYFRDKAPMVKVPRRIHETKSKIGMAKSELQARIGRTPTANDIAEYIGVSLETVLEAMEANYQTVASSLDTAIIDDEEIDLHETTGEEDSNFAAFENSDLLSRVMDELDELEKQLIDMRYFKELTQAQIAGHMNVSQMYISRLEKKILNKIRGFIEL